MDDIDEMMEDPAVRKALLDHYEHERKRLATLEPDEDAEHPALTSDYPGRTGP